MSSAIFECLECGKVFTQRTHLYRHRGNVHSMSFKKRFKCVECNSEYSRKEDLKRHMASHGVTSDFQCPSCLKTFTRADSYSRHLKKSCYGKPTQTKLKEDEGCTDPCEFTTAVQNQVKTYRYKNTNSEINHLTFKDGLLDKIRSTLQKELSDMKGCKWYIAMQVSFIRPEAEDGKTVETTPCFRSKCFVLLGEHEIDNQIAEASEAITKRSWEFQREGSGWIEDKIMYLEVKIGKYAPLAGSSYLPLPSKLQCKKATINVKNDDQCCFLWSILSALHPMDVHPERVQHYLEWKSELNMEGIEYPVAISKVDKFEKQNNISVNVYGYEEELFPLRITKIKCETHVDLLYIVGKETNHYCLIKNFNRLNSGLTKHDGVKFYCHYCLHRYSSKLLLQEHEERCAVHQPQKIRMPGEEHKWLQFQNHFLSLKVPFVIYADFECFLAKVQGCESDPKTSHSTEISKHVPSGFCYVVVNSEGRCVRKSTVYRGENVVDVFLQRLLEEESTLNEVKKSVIPMEITVEEENNFKTSELCHICKTFLGDDRVKDHCHVTGKYRGSAHNKCNLNYKFSSKIPVIIHNLKNYDSHIIMQGIGKINDKRITCIPNNMEKYISFSLGNLQFIDSCQFLNASLEQLVNNLKESENLCKFSVMKQHFNEDELILLLRKGVFPYDYMSSESKMDEISLPPKSAFFSSLTQENISSDDYEHAVKVWEAFNIRNLGEYHDLYVKTDVLLLADVFENFRSLSLDYYEIDPAHLYTGPGFAWQACLKMTGVKLELLTDINMHLFLESGIRGGVSMISNRYAEANNVYMDNYERGKKSKYIMYWDCNNLYGTAMIESLPTSDFRWLPDDEIVQLNVHEIDDEGELGYILEVDLNYPENLHGTHNCYPLAPERIKINKDMLSAFSRALNENLNICTTGNVTKLVPNLMKKEKYVIHYRNLKQYIRLGLQLNKVHRVLEFKQTKWLKPYIEFNTEKRKHARNDFEKDFFKLMNNAVFGKTMENLRNRVNVQLVQDAKKLKKLVSSPAFEGFTIFSSDLVGVKSIKKTLTLNRPIYVGFSILDLSKIIMYEFHYSFIKKIYGNNAKLLFTDTDSLCYEITTDDVYQDLAKYKHLFDFSNYPRDHSLYDKQNQTCLGKMKDEMGGQLVKEFVGLRPKMYSLLKMNGVEKKVAKGVIRSTLKRKIRHENYKKCLFNSKLLSEDMYLIRNSRHQLYTVKQRKIALSPADNKRYLLDNGIETLAYGYYKT